MVSILPPPPIRGIGRAGGFKFMVEDRKDLGVKDTASTNGQAGARLGNALRRPPPRSTPLLVGLASVFRANAPQLYVNLNRAQCMTMDVPLADAFDTLQIYLGSLYVNGVMLAGGAIVGYNMKRVYDMANPSRDGDDDEIENEDEDDGKSPSYDDLR